MSKNAIARYILCLLGGAGCGTLIMGHTSLGVAFIIIGVLAEYTARVEV